MMSSRLVFVAAATALSLLCEVLAQDDPFAALAAQFMQDGSRLRKDREARRDEFNTAQTDFKAAKKTVDDLEKQLKVAKMALERNETKFNAAKAAKQDAEKAMMNSLTGIAKGIVGTADAIKDGKEPPGAHSARPGGKTGGPKLGRVDPTPGKDTIILWAEKNFKGKSVKVKCCGYTELTQMIRDSDVSLVRSITVPEGIHARFHTSAFSGRRGSEASSFDAFGDLQEVDGLVLDYTQSCCSAVDISAGIDHFEDVSVVLYEEENFEGNSVAYREGDFGAVKKLKQVGSIGVPAGLRVTLRATTAGDADGTFGAIIGVLKRDTRFFPGEDTSISQDKRPRMPVKSLSVRRIKDKDLHGLMVYPDVSYKGRPQYFESGHHYLYPETWPDVRSARPTNSTHAMLFTSGGILSIREGIEDLAAKGNSRPHTIESAASCEPQDLCGQHGKCVKPQQCECTSPWQGERCHLQVPDESSAMLCEHNAVVIDEPLPCRLVLRRDNLPVNATSLFLKVELEYKASLIGDLFGSPVVRRESWAGGRPQEWNVFPFDAVFNTSGNLSEPFEFKVFGKSATGAFSPRVEVLPRCDLPGTSANIECKQNTSDAGSAAVCALSLSTVGGASLRCPARSISITLLQDGGSSRKTDEVVIEGDGPNRAVSSRFLFQLQAGDIVKSTRTDSKKKASESLAHFRVEVRHGQGADALVLEATAAMPSLDAVTLRSVAHASLRRGDLSEALQSLEACVSDPPCLRLRADLLTRLGRLSEAEEVLKKLGLSDREKSRKRVSEAMAAHAQGMELLRQGDVAKALEPLSAAIEVSPLSSAFRLARADAALRLGDYDLAVEDARHASRLGESASSDSSPGAALAALGRSLVAVGLGDAAERNFQGCAALEEVAAGSAVAARAKECRDLAMASKALRLEAMELGEVVRSEMWSDASLRADRLLKEHGPRWPHLRLEKTIYGLEAAAAKCLAGAALNISGVEAVVPCRDVAQAPEAMRARLPPDYVLRCHMVLAEALEKAGSAAEALAEAEAAESMLGGEDLDSLAGMVRLLRERLSRAHRKHEEAEGERNGTKKKEERKPPANHYETLGLAKNATLTEIKSAYRKLALKYHPDKNSDPEAVPMFLDIQQAYQVLSDEALRRRYDAGQNVDDEAGAKNMQPMKWKIVEIDKKRGIAKVWWYDPNTGEEGFTEMEVDKEDEDEEKPPSPARARTLREHCCLPEGNEGQEHDEI